jgi:hypothetical protein
MVKRSPLIPSPRSKRRRMHRHTPQKYRPHVSSNSRIFLHTTTTIHTRTRSGRASVSVSRRRRSKRAPKPTRASKRSMACQPSSRSNAQMMLVLSRKRGTSGYEHAPSERGRALIRSVDWRWRHPCSPHPHGALQPLRSLPHLPQRRRFALAFYQIPHGAPQLEVVGRVSSLPLSLERARVV